MSVTFISHKQEVLSAEQKARNKALEIIGGKAESYAKKICPVDTGRLRNSITHQQMDDHTEMIGTNVEYAPFVELPHHSPAGNLIPGKHFLRSAAEGHTAEYREIIEKAMKNA